MTDVEPVSIFGVYQGMGKMKRTKIITENLNADINKLKGSIEILSSVKNSMSADVAFLYSAWKGDAALSFFAVYFSDMERMKNIICELTLLTNWMSYAYELYTAAQERTVEDIMELTL